MQQYLTNITSKTRTGNRYQQIINDINTTVACHFNSKFQLQINNNITVHNTSGA